MPKFFKAPVYTEEQMQEMEEKDMVFPFSSKYMKYDSVKRQYIPTEALLLKHGVNLSDFLLAAGKDPQADMQEELEFISDQVYSCMFKNSGSNTETLKWLVAKGIRRGVSPFRFRLYFEEILWKQARYYTNNDDPTKSTGIDMEQKQWLNKGVLVYEDRNIDPKVKIMLMNLGLCWVGSYDDQFCGQMAKDNW